MIRVTGWVWLVLGCAAGLPAPSQTLTNQALNGKFFFRQVSLGTDVKGTLTDARSLIGAITFDGAGRYSFLGQQVIGTNAATSSSGSGAYTVDPAGFVALDNPLRSGEKVNARLGTEALVGSTTESAGNTFDLFAAIPAPPAGATPTLAGPFWVATLEYPGATLANARSTLFSLNNLALGNLAATTVAGHAANLQNGLPQSQALSGASYVLNSDGTGTVNFGAASNFVLLSGSRNLYLSADGNVLLGGSPASHDILIGIKAMANATASTWNGNFWAAGLRTNSTDTAPVVAYAGSAAARGAASVAWSRRLKSLGFGASDFTAVTAYTLTADGSGTVPLTRLALGAGGKAFLYSTMDATAPNAYQIDFGVQMTPLSGTGVFLSPQGILNAASYAPAGNPISPGEFVALFGTNLAKSTQTAAPPYPLGGLNGVTVLIGNQPAPLYFVSATQINALVPYSVQGPTTTVVVQNGGVNSNTVTVPVAASAPGAYSLDSSGGGSAAVLHADYSLVNAAKPAAAGETVLVYLTGLGAVSPAVPDGTAGGASPLSATPNPPTVLIGGEQGTVLYSGLAPGYPGLYQINVTLPPLLPTKGNLPLAIATDNAFHDQVYIPVQ